MLLLWQAPSACSTERISLLELGSTGGSSSSGGVDSGGAGEVQGGAGGDDVYATGGGSPTGGDAAMGGTPPVIPPRVLLVVDENPISTDQAVENRLVGLGAEVTRISELVVRAEDVEGYDMFVVSPSADGVDTPPSLNEVAVPMLLLEPSVTAKMGFGGVSHEAAQMSATVMRPAHPLAAGKSGTVVVCSGEVSLEGTRAAAKASILDSAGGTHSVLFVHEKNETVSIKLPATRVGLSLIKGAACQTETSWQFFDAAFQYLLGD